MKVAVLAGGVGGARFTRGLIHQFDRSGESLDLTVIVNTGDVI